MNLPICLMGNSDTIQMKKFTSTSIPWFSLIDVAPILSLKANLTILKPNSIVLLESVFCNQQVALHGLVDPSSSLKGQHGSMDLRLLSPQ